MDNKLETLLRELEVFKIENDAHTSDHARMMLNITHETGEFLLLLIRAARAKRVLEIGTSNGYSTIWLAHAVQPLKGHVTTVERAAHKIEMARANFKRAGLESFIQIEHTDANDFMARPTREVSDFIFLDGPRQFFAAWWKQLQTMLAGGGLIVADNATTHPDEMKEFMRVVGATSGFITSVVPIGNGEFIALKENVS